MSHIVTQSTSLQHVIPCYPGYAMGGVILNADLELPHLGEELIDIANRIEQLQLQKKNIKENIEKAKLKEKSDEISIKKNTKKAKLKEKSDEINDQQNKSNPQEIDNESSPQLDNLNLEIIQFEKLQETVKNKLKKFKEEKEKTSSFKTMLPIDNHRTMMRIELRADESENMHFITLQAQTASQQIDSFKQYLTQNRYLPTVVKLIDQIAKSILQTPQDNQKVCLLGSFITLSRVRVMDPIFIRDNAKIDEHLLQNHTKYSVISEAVLGGVFIGFGTLMEKELEKQIDQTDKAQPLASQLHIFSFVSQGAIPISQQFNLWETYLQWKKMLREDQYSGFPIAFKVRSLTDVFSENQITPLSGDEKHNTQD